MNLETEEALEAVLLAAPLSQVLQHLTRLAQAKAEALRQDRETRREAGRWEATARALEVAAARCPE